MNSHPLYHLSAYHAAISNTFSIMSVASPHTSSQDAVISIQDLNPDITSIVHTEIQEKDSIFLHVVETQEEYPSNMAQEEIPQSNRTFFYCKIYTIKDTILADYLKELVMQKNIYEPYLIKESKDWTWYGTKGSTQFILKGNQIISLDFQDLQEYQISFIIDKLDM